jgi:hypothetical protein
MYYQLNFYPTEKGDGIYRDCKTKAEAMKEFKKLQEKYPARTGSAFIRVWRNYDAKYEGDDYIKDIDL